MTATRYAAALWACLLIPAVHAAEPVPLNRIVAVVNTDVITELELAKEVTKVSAQLRAQRTQLPPPAVLREQVLNRAISMRLQADLAAARRIRVDDDTLNRTIEDIAKRNKVDIAAFRGILERDGIVFADFREDIRQEMTLARLRQQEVASRVTVSEQEVDTFLANEAVRGSSTDEYHLAHILVAVPESATPEKIALAQRKAERVLARLKEGADFAQTAVAESDGQQALEGGELGWRKAAQMPSLFATVVPGLKPGEVTPILRSPSGFHIVKLVETRHDQTQHKVMQWHARHILIKSGALLTDEEAKARAENLRDRLRTGEDFAELARAHSDDRGSAAQGGDLGWINPGDTVPPFEQALKTLADGELSTPVQSRFGWHLIQMLERREQDNTAEVRRNRARNAIRERKMDEAEEDWLRRLRDEAFVEIRA